MATVSCCDEAPSLFYSVALQSTSRQFGEICRANEWPISASRSISWTTIGFKEAAYEHVRDCLDKRFQQHPPHHDDHTKPRRPNHSPESVIKLSVRPSDATTMHPRAADDDQAEQSCVGRMLQLPGLGSVQGAGGGMKLKEESHGSTCTKVFPAKAQLGLYNNPG